MVPEIRPLARGMRMAGPALTVACPPGDNLMLHAAVADAAPGDILVAQCHDFTFGVWGEVLMTAAQARGIAGLIPDGAGRGVEALERAGFPVFCRAVSMRAATEARRGDSFKEAAQVRVAELARENLESGAKHGGE